MFGREDKSMAKHERNRGITRKISYVGVAFIMDQVNGPQYTVWANRKFVGKNKEEVEQHILADRKSSSIN